MLPSHPLSFIQEVRNGQPRRMFQNSAEPDVGYLIAVMVKVHGG